MWWRVGIHVIGQESSTRFWRSQFGRALGVLCVLLLCLLTAVFAARSPSPSPHGSGPAARRGASCDRLPPRVYVLEGASARIRLRPSLRSQVLGMLYPQHRFSLHARDRGWVRVTDTTTGVQGWVTTALLQPKRRACGSSPPPSPDTGTGGRRHPAHDSDRGDGTERTARAAHPGTCGNSSPPRASCGGSRR
ncbi:SH3 domain-containing protein [Streptomyces monticola]|uniref:SH3 domain-containing protein n=1 Tax=Streptomyces monticola TaxID=2666263 RepID=A0ABW2JFA1_9ACTN